MHDVSPDKGKAVSPDKGKAVSPNVPMAEPVPTDEKSEQHGLLPV